MRMTGILLLFTLLFIFDGHLAVASAKQSKLLGSHGDRSLMPKSCRACHRGMSMIIRNEEQVCFNCHGSEDARQQFIDRGYLKPRAFKTLTNIEEAIQKPYSHPTLSVRGAHVRNETLPEDDLNAPRHAECADCHDVHSLDEEFPFSGIKGKKVGNFTTQIDHEYELCYKCHSSSMNLPSSSTDKRAEFNLANPSYHPIEGEGKSTYVVSLLAPYVARKEKEQDISTISCSDCHGNDDAEGPIGPHGSIYAGLLKFPYEMLDGEYESSELYALCYQCHNRDSILGNESFRYHQQHIQGFTPDVPGTSCFTCHDAHGSTENPYLIRFNEDVVSPPVDGKIEFKPDGVATYRGSCTLVCHDVEHNPKEY